MESLKAAGALSRETAIGPYHPAWKERSPGSCNPNVLGATRSKGFSSSRTSRAGGSQQTLYWLTPEGLAELARLEDEDDDELPSKGNP